MKCRFRATGSASEISSRCTSPTANDDTFNVFEVSSAADARNTAGNTLENALQKMILDRTGLSPGSQEYRSAALAIRRQRRFRKEDLFRDGSVIVELPTDESVRIELLDFLAYAPVVKFSQTVAEMVAKAAAAMAPDGGRVFLVATGGGARLPLIEQLGRDGVIHKGRHFALTPREAIPDTCVSSIRTSWIHTRNLLWHSAARCRIFLSSVAASRRVSPIPSLAYLPPNTAEPAASGGAACVRSARQAFRGGTGG